MKKVAIYTRISTTDKGQDLETQLLPLKEYAKAREWEIFAVYEDKMSGSKERPSRTPKTPLSGSETKI
jgi:DNA invertase Pin-like site-specific DNA recombinase